MGATVSGKAMAWLEAYRLLAVNHPLEGGLYLAAMAVLAVVAVVQIVRGRGGQAFWAVVACILASLVFAFGEDIGHHVYRLVAVRDQLRQGHLSLLLTDATGESLPIFVFYSFIPYLPAIALNLVGLSAHAALKVVLVGAFFVMALGLWRLVELASERGLSRNAGHLIAILFVSANYVHGVWLMRTAFAELSVYCLIPWVVVVLLRKDRVGLAALLFLQMAIHPVVFIQAFAAELVVAWALSRESPLAMARACIVPVIAALLAASPFWLPQILWKGLILGPEGLPVRFADTFLTWGELFDRRSYHTVGFFLPLAVVVTIAATGARLSGRAWLLVGAFAVSLVIQTQSLRPIAQHIPTLSYSLFVWRLMLPAAFIGFGALLVAWRTPPVAREWPLAAVTLLATLNVLVVLIGGAPATIALSLEPRGDRHWYQGYSESRSPWGKREFAANYAAVPARCDVPTADLQVVPFDQLTKGMAARTAYLAVPQAPLGILRYLADGKAAEVGGCGESLVLGPLPPGATVRGVESAAAWLLWLRLGVFALLAMALMAVLAARRIRHN
jgi:hypothetical protein